MCCKITIAVKQLIIEKTRTIEIFNASLKRLSQNLNSVSVDNFKISDNFTLLTSTKVHNYTSIKASKVFI